MTVLSSEGDARRRWRRLIISVVAVSLGIHLIAALVAGAVIVARYLAQPPAEFKAVKDIRIPAQQREHRMNMAAFDGAAPKPSFTDKLQSLRPAPFALPEMPKLSMDQTLPLDPSEILNDQVASLAGLAGLGIGAGEGVAGRGGRGAFGAGFSFMGIESTGRRILLLFDVSSSVLNKAQKSGVPLTRIREETQTWLRQLPINARFGIIQFTQNFKAFRTELLAASEANRDLARKWIDEEWVEGGTMAASSKVARNPRGLVGVLELAAKMEPDVIFLISDASFQWKAAGTLDTVPWEEIKKIVKGPLQGAQGCAVNFIGFQMKPADRNEMAAIVRSTHGRLREIK